VSQTVESPSESIVVVLDPDADEALRYALKVYIRTPMFLALAIFVLCVAALLFITAPVVIRDGDPTTGYGYIILGLVMVVGLPIAFRVAVKRRIAKALSEADKNATWTFSDSGIDVRSAHTSSHFDWEAVKQVRAARAGVLVVVWGRTYVLFQRYFKSRADYDSLMKLALSKLGERARL
jgi:hypothetical protein